MVSLFDGKRTLKEIASVSAQEEGTSFELIHDSLEHILRELIDVLALGTPDFTQCHRCYQNCT